MNFVDTVVERNHCLPSLRQKTMETGVGIQNERAMRGRQPKNQQLLPAGGSPQVEPAAPPLGWREGLNSKSRHRKPLAAVSIFGVEGFFWWGGGKDIHPNSSIPAMVRGTEFQNCHGASYLPPHVSPASSGQLPGGQSNLHPLTWLSPVRLGTRPWTRLGPAPVRGPLAGSQQTNTLLPCLDLPYRAGILGDHR